MAFGKSLKWNLAEIRTMFATNNQFRNSNICNLNSNNFDPLIQSNMDIPNDQQVSLHDA